MQKIIFFFIGLFLVIPASFAQNLRIYNPGNYADVTGATIMVQSPDNHGYVGFESLDVAIKVVNTSAGSIVVGAKKIEEDTLQPDVQHTICFGGACYPTTTFVSYNHVTLATGTSDSGFIAHYLFDNTVHVRGINHVSYVFYDVANPSDSVVVHVIYNTIMNTAVGQLTHNYIALQVFPNPANEQLTFMHNSTSGGQLLLTNAFGQTVAAIAVATGDKQFSCNALNLPAGMYYYTFFTGISPAATGTIIVKH